MLCDPTHLTVVAAIELDDKRYEAASREQRDSFVGAALGSAGIPLHQFSVKRSYSVHEVRTVLSTMDGTDELEALPSGRASKPLGDGTHVGGPGRSSRGRL